MYLEVTNIDIKEVEGSRICLDFVACLNEDEGVYVGNTSNGYIKLMAEINSTKNYMARPFRINCGALHQYLYTTDKTFYLTDIASGTEVELFSKDSSRKLVVGRAKMETRKLAFVYCEKDDLEISATLQFVESVYLEGEEGRIPIDKLKVGDKIKCLLDGTSRHLGEKTDESIIER